MEGLQNQIDELEPRLQQLEAQCKDLEELEQSNKQYEQQLWSTHAEVRKLQEDTTAHANQQRLRDPAHRETSGSSRQDQLNQATRDWLRQVGAHLLLATIYSNIANVQVKVNCSCLAI